MVFPSGRKIWRRGRSMTEVGLHPKRRVFLLEDETLISHLLEEMLGELGYEIADSVSAMDQALRSAETTTAEIAVLDVNIRGNPCYPVAEALMARGLRVLFLTGFAPLGIQARYRDARVLVKPIFHDSLGQALSELCAEGGAA